MSAISALASGVSAYAQLQTTSKPQQPSKVDVDKTAESQEPPKMAIDEKRGSIIDTTA